LFRFFVVFGYTGNGREFSRRCVDVVVGVVWVVIYFLLLFVVGEGAFVVVVIVGGGDLVGVFGADNALEAS
jgi:hypothetical protein